MLEKRLFREVFVAGGSGLFGLNFAQTVSKNIDVTLGLHSRLINPRYAKVAQVALEPIDKLINFLKNHKFDLVVNAAGLTNIERCHAACAEANLANTQVAVNISRACKKLGIKFIHLSTDHLFTGTKSFITESDAVRPLNTYAETKAQAEAEIAIHNPDTLIIRTNFYGVGPYYRQSISDFIIQNLEGGKEFSLWEDIYFTPINVNDLSIVIMELAERGASGIFNIPGNKRVSKYQFGLAIADVFDLDGSLIQRKQALTLEGPIKRPLDMSLSNLKALNFLGRPFGDFNAGIRQLRQNYNNQFKSRLIS